ncbi:NfeD family protein [Uliginosibacterium sp. H1]|uniref:NfeD family protein n=1 Tax=Uliginosibacterium sp. H1 TaxID=3114757 RepID=UPI002E18BC8F|nr:NfeD family protein [Uliginosibacterium sp. H1]
MLWWHWIAAGFVLIVAELAIPAFFLVWLGIAALITGVLVAILPLGNAAQVLVWALLSAALVIAWVKVFRRKPDDLAIGTAGAVIGEAGLLVGDLGPFQKSQVRFQRPVLGSDVWECVSDVEIKSGSRVKVVAVEGKSVRVAVA